MANGIIETIIAELKMKSQEGQVDNCDAICFFINNGTPINKKIALQMCTMHLQRKKVGMSLIKINSQV